jgi:hypothetical protein
MLQSHTHRQQERPYAHHIVFMLVHIYCVFICAYMCVFLMHAATYSRRTTVHPRAKSQSTAARAI